MGKVDFNSLVLRELMKVKYGRIVPFPLVFYRLGCIFHFDREVFKLILKDLEKRKLIRIHSFHGIEILKT